MIKQWLKGRNDLTLNIELVEGRPLREIKINFKTINYDGKRRIVHSSGRANA